MNKLEALVITGKLEVRFQGKEQLLNEVANLQKFIAENDFDNLAISFGRLSELTKDFTPNVSDYINSLYDFIFEVKEPLKREQELGLKEKLAMTLEELDVSLRTFNCLRRAGINTVADIINIPKSCFFDATKINSIIETASGCSIKNLGSKSAHEVLEKIESLGLKWPEEKKAKLPTVIYR